MDWQRAMSNTPPEERDPLLAQVRELEQRADRAAKDRTAHELVGAFRLLSHGHPLECVLSAMAATLVELGSATVGFETTMQIIVDARVALMKRAQAAHAEAAAQKKENPDAQ